MSKPVDVPGVCKCSFLVCKLLMFLMSAVLLMSKVVDVPGVRKSSWCLKLIVEVADGCGVPGFCNVPDV